MFNNITDDVLMNYIFDKDFYFHMFINTPWMQEIIKKVNSITEREDKKKYIDKKLRKHFENNDSNESKKPMIPIYLLPGSIKFGTNKREVIAIIKARINLDNYKYKIFLLRNEDRSELYEVKTGEEETILSIKCYRSKKYVSNRWPEEVDHVIVISFWEYHDLFHSFQPKPGEVINNSCKLKKYCKYNAMYDFMNGK